MEKQKKITYGLLLMASILLVLAAAVFGTGSAWARYDNATYWTTIVQPENTLSSDCLLPDGQIILLGEISEIAENEESDYADISFQVWAETECTARVEVDMEREFQEYLEVELRDSNGDEMDSKITLTEEGTTFMLELFLTDAALELEEELEIDILVTLKTEQESLEGTFRLTLPAKVVPEEEQEIPTAGEKPAEGSGGTTEEGAEGSGDSTGGSGESGDSTGGSDESGDSTGGSDESGDSTGGSDESGDSTGGSDESGDSTGGSDESGDNTGGSSESEDNSDSSTGSGTNDNSGEDTELSAASVSYDNLDTEAEAAGDTGSGGETDGDFDSSGDNSDAGADTEQDGSADAGSGGETDGGSDSSSGDNSDAEADTEGDSGEKESDTGNDNTDQDDPDETGGDNSGSTGGNNDQTTEGETGGDNTDNSGAEDAEGVETPEAPEPPEGSSGGTSGTVTEEETEPEYLGKLDDMLSTVREFSKKALLPIGLDVPEGCTQVILDMDGEDLPAYTRYSLDDGETWYMLYFGGTVEIDGAELEDMAIGSKGYCLLMDLSYTDWDTAKTLGFCATAYTEDGYYTDTADASSYAMLPNTRSMKTPLILRSGGTLSLAVTESWSSETKSEMLLERLELQGETAEYVAVTDGSVQAEFGTDSVIISAGEARPKAGTYRLTITYSYNGMNFAQSQITFFVNYSEG